MPSLPRKFLLEIAQERGLTEFQTGAFVERLVNIESTDLVVAKIMNISRDRYSSRMVGVYKKFGIAGKGRGKARVLFFKVLGLYNQRLESSNSSLPIITNKNGVFNVRLSKNQTIDNIKVINASNKSIKETTGLIGEFKELSFLDISNNSLEELPPELGNLSKLKTLILRNNNILSLPPEIGKLSNLEFLDISYNRIEELPVEINKLKKLEAFNIQGTSLNIPPELLDGLDTPQEILDYYFQNIQKTHQRKNLRLDPSARRRLNEAKVLLVGEAKVGKTSLLRRIVDKTFDPNEVKTEGINVKSCFVPIKGEKVRLNLWDFGGQEIMHATHQFFLTKRSLYLLVLDSRRDEAGNRIEYWLKIIESFGGDSPIIIVGNQVDQHPFDIDRRGLRKKYPSIKAFVETSCQSSQGITKLIRAIQMHVGGLEHVFDELPSSWLYLKNVLENLDKDYISYITYLRACDKYGINNQRNQELLIGFLHDLGIVLNFRDDPRLQQDNILNPEWITNAVYKILNDHDLMINCRGILGREMLNRILDRGKYPVVKHSFILDMMRKFELCFPLEGYANEKYLLPDLLTKEEPETGDWSQALSVRYQYNVLPTSIISRFIVRMNQLISKHTYWRNGVVLRKGANTALVKADREEQLIYIFVIGHPRTRRFLVESIRDQLDHIHDTIPSLQVKEQISLPEQPEIWIDYKHLLTLESMGEQEWIPPGYNKKINIQSLLAGIESSLEKQVSFKEIEDGGGKIISKTQKEISIKRSMRSQSPWNSGFFYLFALSLIAIVFAVISYFIAWYVLPVVIIGALLAIGMVGALQLRQDNRFSEKNFLKLIVEAYKQFPLLRKHRSEDESDT